MLVLVLLVVFVLVLVLLIPLLLLVLSSIFVRACLRVLAPSMTVLFSLGLNLFLYPSRPAPCLTLLPPLPSSPLLFVSAGLRNRHRTGRVSIRGGLFAEGARVEPRRIRGR